MSPVKEQNYTGTRIITYYLPPVNTITNEVTLKEAEAPITGDGLRAYYASDNPKPALLQWYSPNGSAKINFKKLLKVMQKWLDRVGWLGFLTLINFPPRISASIVNRSEDLTSIEKRYSGIYAPISPPPLDNGWIVANYIHINYMFFNNYGRHEIKSKAIATAFTWDWLGMAAPICGVGCISINDKLLVWTRWTESGIQIAAEIFSPELGEPVGSAYQTPVT